MGHVAAERDLDHDDEDEPQQVECIEVDDEDEECSTSNDPPQLQRPNSTETSAFKVSTKSSDCTLSAEAKPALQPQKYFLDLPPATELSEFIQSRVNGILKGEGVQHVCVREVHCQPMLFTPSSEFQDFLKEYIPKEIIYTWVEASKAWSMDNFIHFLMEFSSWNVTHKDKDTLLWYTCT